MWPNLYGSEINHNFALYSNLRNLELTVEQSKGAVSDNQTSVKDTTTVSSSTFDLYLMN